MARKRAYPLPKRFSVALSETASANLRALNARYDLGNTYLLVVLLENLDRVADPERLHRAFEAFIAESGAPAPPERTHEGD